MTRLSRNRRKAAEDESTHWRSSTVTTTGPAGAPEVGEQGRVASSTRSCRDSSRCRRPSCRGSMRSVRTGARSSAAATAGSSSARARIPRSRSVTTR